MTEALRVDRRVVIPAEELSIRSSPSGGPGGQHANRSQTRIELLWDLEGSGAVGPRQRARLRRKLRGRIDAAGRVRVVADERRSQARNRDEARDRLAVLIREGLAEPKPRKPTRPSRAARERRLREKRHRGDLKRRRRVSAED